MRKSLICLGIMLSLSAPVFAAQIPDNVRNFVSNDFPKTNFRFDGVIILPDNTLYLPLFPARIVDTDKLEIKTTYPSNKTLADKPNIVIFNNDFALLKVLTDTHGNKTIYKMANPPAELRSGLLPQDMLVPKGLIIPENLHGIIGNLEIKTVNDPGIRVENVTPRVEKISGSTLKTLSQIPQLKNKNFYVSSPYSKNIQVLNAGAKTPEYSLAQNNIPISLKAYEDFLLVTSYGKPSIDVISLADDQVIKQIYTKTQPDEILIDKNKRIAYVSSSEDSSIYMVNLETMTLTKQIRISGMCEKLTLSEDGSKLFYYDKKTREIWAIELDNNYLLKEIGKFPNVSKILYTNNKIYLTSRTKNRLAIIDYDTIGLIGETEVCEKPVDMLAFHDRIYVLGAGDNSIQVIDAKTDMITDSIYLNTNGFSTKIYHIEGTNIALITDTKASLYTVFDLGANKVLKSIPIDIPASSIVATEKVKKINK
ncbi:40-residue YVTN family beta-propeller repeat protein [Clostridium sp. CAG:967]|nr:40-residue YVTN family beta-propeller repeat protein [Clostridium sp. CAG:967]